MWHVAFVDLNPVDAVVPGFRNRVLCGLLRLLKPGYRHCLAFRECGDGQWLIVNPTNSRLYVGLWEVPPDYAPVTTQIVPDVPVDCAVVWRPRGLFTCVGAVKHLLGMQAPFVWTPWQLYLYLKEQNDGRTIQ